jgi:DNA modification methylase
VREEKDGRHICPLQLQVIERGLELWSNPRDLVFDPFAGIGSTGHVALGMGRTFLGIELKHAYFKQAVANCRKAQERGGQLDLFSGQEVEEDTPFVMEEGLT